MSTQEMVSAQNLVILFVGGALGIAVIVMLIATFFTVQQRTIAIVQRLGKFVREAGPGLHVKVPFIDRVVGRVNLRVQQLDVKNGFLSKKCDRRRGPWNGWSCSLTGL